MSLAKRQATNFSGQKIHLWLPKGIQRYTVKNKFCHDAGKQFDSYQTPLEVFLPGKGGTNSERPLNYHWQHATRKSIHF